MTDEHELKTEVWQAALAGLLHDMGKFAQRADVGKREMTDSQALGEVKYAHALYSDSFVQEHVPPVWRSQITAPRRHHYLQTDQDYQVQLADWLSSGEREEDEDNQVPYLLSIFARLAGHTDHAYLPLSRLRFEPDVIFPVQGEPGDWRREYRNQYERLWNEFATECKHLPADSPMVYLESLYGLMQEFTWCIPSAYHKSVPDVSLFDHARTTAALAACLAVDERNAAWCQEVTKGITQHTAGEQRACALLVGGDISGVQSFLYTLASSGAAKSLRARSFYLQLLTEAVAEHILDQLGLPITNLLYAGGGNFFLLAGVEQEQVKRLAKAAREVSQKLLDAHDGALHLALAAVPVQAYEFKRTNYCRAWNRLHQQLAIEKKRPLADLEPKPLAEQIGAARGDGGDTETVCDVCGRESKRKIPVDKDGVRKCKFCDSLEKLGQDLSRATHLVWLKSSALETVSQEPTEWWNVLMAFGANVYAVNVNDAPGQAGYISDWPDQLELVRVSPLDRHSEPQSGEESLAQPERRRGEQPLFDELARHGKPIITAYRLFAQLAPHNKNGQVKTFDDLAQDGLGVKRWGVLRMDVDNLGNLFRAGFVQAEDSRRDRNKRTRLEGLADLCDGRCKQCRTENNLTLSRVASLSFSMRLFFEGWLPQLEKWLHEGDDPAWTPTWVQARANDPAGLRPDVLYVQYTGGDDVFVVGAWDALPGLAARIRESFRLYTCRNPSVTLSAGITLHNETFPLYLAAEQAGDAEKKAKHFERVGERTADKIEKDAVCFLDQPGSWEQVGEVASRARQLAEWCGGERPSAPKSVIQSLLAIDAEFQQGAPEKRDKAKHYFGPWVWHAVYKLTRTIESLRKAPDDVAQTLERWETELLDRKTQAITIIGLSARWAELLTRKEHRA